MIQNLSITLQDFQALKPLHIYQSRISRYIYWVGRVNDERRNFERGYMLY